MSASSTFGKVAVLAGGASSERAISLRSGEAVLAALHRQAVNAQLVDPCDHLMERLQTEQFDRAFIILHGQGGEDGVMQGFLETLGLPYTGSGVLGSSLAMDKCRSKRVWRDHGLSTPHFVELSDNPDWEAVIATLGLPMIVKPVREGSSYGASQVDNKALLPDAWREARRYDERVLAESWIVGKEYTASILGNKILPIIRLETPRAFYDYEAKYLATTTRYHCPCGLPPALEESLGELSHTAFKVLDAHGWGRVDLILDESDRPWLIEVNTVPGMTDHSLMPMSAQQAGMDFDALTLEILATSL